MERKYTNRLRELRDKSGLTQAKVAELVGISDNAYQRYEYGERDIPGNVLLRLADCFETTSDYILELSDSDSSEPQGWVPVPLVGRIAAGVPLEMDAIDDYLLIPAPIHARYPGCFCLTVTGNSMDRIMPDGCYAVIDRCDSVDVDNKPYAVCVNGYDATIKRVRKLERGFELAPDSTDPTFKPKVYDADNPTDDEVTIIGRVVYHVMPFDWEY
ncbi:MAG: helix-turn-helix domain-containing protein [Eggerthellaceae bacterium]|nr:helix-turn-helix domain-containing protein [Eggerthellaceae bacterium]